MINCIRKLGSVIKIKNLSFFNGLFIGNQNNSKTFNYNGNLKVVINGNQLENFTNKNKLFKLELETISEQVKKGEPLTTKHLKPLQEKFNAVETDFEQMKLSRNHINEIRDFPSTAIIYYEIIISIYEKEGHIISPYQEKKQYYERLSN